jgi:hypothetical protein
MKPYQQIIAERLATHKKVLIFRPRCQGKRKMYYKLDKDKNVIPAKDCMEWATAFENSEGRRVKEDWIGNCRVSTMFFGTSMCPESCPPLVFETMVFKNGSSIYQDRYATWKQAVKGHKQAVKWVKDGCKED